MILAENDDRVRQITADLRNVDPATDKWQTNKHLVPICYAYDAWDGLANEAQKLTELLTFAKPDTEVIIVAGSPCQDLTIYGRFRGYSDLRDRDPDTRTPFFIPSKPLKSCGRSASCSLSLRMRGPCVTTV